MSPRHFDAEHFEPLRYCLVNLLSSPMAELTYAQIIVDYHLLVSMQKTGLLMEHQNLYPGVLEKIQRLRAQFQYSILKIPARGKIPSSPSVHANILIYTYNAYLGTSNISKSPGKEGGGFESSSALETGNLGCCRNVNELFLLMVPKSECNDICPVYDSQNIPVSRFERDTMTHELPQSCLILFICFTRHLSTAF